MGRVERGGVTGMHRIIPLTAGGLCIGYAVGMAIHAASLVPDGLLTPIMLFIAGGCLLLAGAME